MAQKIHPFIKSRIGNYNKMISSLRELSRFLTHIEGLFEGSGAAIDATGYNKDRRVRLSWFDSEVELNFNYDHVLADAEDLRTLRQAGYYQTDKKGDWYKPQTDKATGITTYHLFHEKWKDGNVPVAKLIAGIREGDTATCKKVKVRTETRQVDVYEVRCNGMEIDEAPQIVETETSRVRGS